MTRPCCNNNNVIAFEFYISATIKGFRINSLLPCQRRPGESRYKNSHYMIPSFDDRPMEAYQSSPLLL